MSGSVLIAGLGNIFQGDDAFGVAVVQRLVTLPLPESVRVMDVGIRAIDLGFALLDGYDMTILADATARGGEPGTLYTIGIEPEDIPDIDDPECIMNAHALNPLSVLAVAKSRGANFGRVFLVGCEPLVLDHDESGHIGLSEPVEAAVDPAVRAVKQLVDDFLRSEQPSNGVKEDEVCFYERA